jgi:DNA (cytosine-5)-methyltransferase 1
LEAVGVVRILDLYCGMGGLSLGLALALEDVEIAGLDVDGNAVGTYNLNLSRLGCRAEVRDVLRWDPSGSFDVVVGGPPCQPFSIANNRVVGERHPLYPTFPRFFDTVLSLRPKVFLLENVRGLLMRRNRHHLERQLARVSGEYAVSWRVLNAVDYGVPQRRERLIAVGVRRGLGVRFGFPTPTHAPEEHTSLDGRRIRRWLTLGEAIGDLLQIPPAEGLRNLSPKQSERIWRERLDTCRHRARMEFPDPLDRPSRTVSSHTVGGTKRETIVIPFLDSGGRIVGLPWTRFQEKHPPLSLDEPATAVVSHLAKSSRNALVPIPDHVLTAGGGWDNPSSDWGSRVMGLGEPAYTITEKHRSGQLVPIPPIAVEAMGKPSPSLVADARVYATGRREHGADIQKGCYRRLTVRECLRLQSFPDWWRFPDRVSVSKRYRLVGEAVPPILAYRLGVALGRALGFRTREPPREGEWALPYFRRAFADYLDGGGEV